MAIIGYFHALMFSALITSINRIGILPTDEGIEANKKRFVVYESILMSFGGILWGTICLLLAASSNP